MTTRILKSELDDSVNFVVPYYNGSLEARYVRRSPDYFVCYLSSQSGCNRGCKFCHLTTTGQTSQDQVGAMGFFDQANMVFSHYITQAKAREVNYNWMARGEALANPNLTTRLNKSVFEKLEALALSCDVIPKFNISTIMPKSFQQNLAETFRGVPYPTIYYSLYSVNEQFREKWLPGAMPVDAALENLADYQRITQKIVTIHYALISGENDSSDDAWAVGEALQKYDLKVNLNLVRYNAPDGLYQESKFYGSYETLLQGLFPKHVLNAKTVNRVGYDVAASCGMFVQ